MNSKEPSRLSMSLITSDQSIEYSRFFNLVTIFLCISLLVLFFQCTFSQPITKNLLDVNIKENGDDKTVDSIWIRPMSSVDSDEMNSEENNSKELAQLLLKYHILNEQDEHNRLSLSSPVRRSNFWKRANFWRKRSNFWRRDFAA